MIRFVTLATTRYTHELFAFQCRKVGGIDVEVNDYSQGVGDDFFGDIVILCDHERFTDFMMPDLLTYADSLKQVKVSRILNDPRRVLRRYDLLSELRSKGLNPHGAYRWPFNDPEMTFPVFLRNEFDHSGPVSELVYNDEELKRRMEELQTRMNLGNLLAIEYVDIRKNAVDPFHKFGAVLLDKAVVPRHLFFSENWVTKRPTKQTPQDLDFEFEYVSKEKYSDQISAIFGIAGIDYGRIDFAVIKGRLITFEINTNPHILDSGDLEHGSRRRITDLFLDQMIRILRRMENNR